ncbi:hypothetical protein BH24BAC1_BH24BAC1_15060 [soil metagenome]
MKTYLLFLLFTYSGFLGQLIYRIMLSGLVIRQETDRLFCTQRKNNRWSQRRGHPDQRLAFRPPTSPKNASMARFTSSLFSR